MVTGWRRVLLVLHGVFQRQETAGVGRLLAGCSRAAGGPCLCYARYGYGNCYNASF